MMSRLTYRTLAEIRQRFSPVNCTASTFANWDGMTIIITNADFNVDNGILFVDESTNRVGIGTTSPNRKLDIQTPLGHTILRLGNGGNGNRSGIDFYRESSAGTMKGGAGIWVESDTSASGGVLAFSTANNSGLTSMSPKMVLDNSGRVGNWDNISGQKTRS